MAKIACVILLTIPAYGDMLLEYYDIGQSGFTSLQSISDGSDTEYALFGGNQNTWPIWVDSVSDPSWAQITYGASEEMTYRQGLCSTGGAGCGMITYTTSTVEVMFSSNQPNGDEFLFVDPPADAPESDTFAMAGLVLFFLLARLGLTGSVPKVR